MLNVREWCFKVLRVYYYFLGIVGFIGSFMFFGINFERNFIGIAFF